ncbi:universal stress protein [Natrinema amylolyticum]|uniref:universal stress protein n=1 Tax=Natrinema amylolyticum TaxID=2878679 RepID=UPI001CFC147B|nr:universal stress protein [Natrinema amylolyticum]
MYRIVIPVDPDEERAMEAADYVAGLLEDGPVESPDELAVTVLNVFEEFSAVDDGVRVTSDELFDPDDVPESVDAVRDALEAAGIDVDVVRRHGEPAEEIVDYADSVDADTIVLPTRERSPVGKAVFGSVTQQVMLETDRPVTVL